MEFLKPNKMNIIGTAALLVANWVGSFASRSIMRLVVAGNETAGGFAGAGGRGAFAGGAGAAGAQAGNFGLISGAASIIITAILFYLVISFVAGKFGKESRASGKEAGKS